MAYKDINETIQDKIGKPSLHYAVTHSYSESGMIVLSYEDIAVNMEDNYRITPLHYGIDMNNPEFVEQLLSYTGLISMLQASRDAPHYVYK